MNQFNYSNVSMHLHPEGKLCAATVKEFLIVLPDGTHKEFLSVYREGKREVSRSIDFHNLERKKRGKK